MGRAAPKVTGRVDSPGIRPKPPKTRSMTTPVAVLLADPAYRLRVAVHEVGHFALACANCTLPRGISIGGDDAETVGRCGVGSVVPPMVSGRQPAKLRSARNVWALRSAAVALAGYVAEASLDGLDPGDELRALADAGDTAGDVAEAFAWCAWTVGVECRTEPDGDDVSSLLSYRLDVDDYPPRVQRAVDEAMRVAAVYLARHWSTVMRMARTLASAPPDDDGRRELSERSVYRWAKRFPPHATTKGQR